MGVGRQTFHMQLLLSLLALDIYRLLESLHVCTIVRDAETFVKQRDKVVGGMKAPITNSIRLCIYSTYTERKKEKNI